LLGALSAEAQLFETLHHKPEVRGFHSCWSQLNFSLTYALWPYYGAGVDSAYSRNEHNEYFLGVKATGA
jgi:hypothetical protein